MGLQIDAVRLKALSAEPDILGRFIAAIVLPLGRPTQSIDVDPEGGWQPTQPSRWAEALYPGLPSAGYADPLGRVSLTLVETGSSIALIAEGRDWAIHSPGADAPWSEITSNC